MDKKNFETFRIPPATNEEVGQIIGHTVDSLLMSKFLIMADGNPGAATVLKLLLANPKVEDITARLDSLKIHGPFLWALFKDVCGEDIDKLAHLVLNCPADVLANGALKPRRDDPERLALKKYLTTSS